MVVTSGVQGPSMLLLFYFLQQSSVKITHILIRLGLGLKVMGIGQLEETLGQVYELC